LNEIVFLNFAGLTPKMLEKDYVAVVGQPLPFRKFGYFNACDFLRSLTDILRVTIQHNQTILLGIADKSTEHIMKLVKKQKKPKFYNSITSTQPQPTSSKKKFQSSSNLPSALTRAGMLKVLNGYPDGFSIMKLHDYYRELNGTKLDIKRTDEIPAFILSMSDIAKLEYGKREKSGNNLYIYPSKTLCGYQKFRNQNFRSNDQLPKLSHPPGLSSFSKATTCTTNTTVQSWVNSVNSCHTVVVTSTSSSTASTSGLTHSNGVNNKNQTALNSLLNFSCSRPPRLQKLSSATSSGIMSQTSSSTSGTYSESDPSPTKSVIEAKSSHTRYQKIEGAIPSETTLLKQEIVELLQHCTTEIRSIKLPSMYKKKYGKELNYQDHGYFSIVELISTMTDKINMCRLNRTGDWLLKLRRAKSEKSSGMLVFGFLFIFM